MKPFCPARNPHGPIETVAQDENNRFCQIAPWASQVIEGELVAEGGFEPPTKGL